MVLTSYWMVPISIIFEPTEGLTLASYPSHPLMVGSAAPMTKIVNVWFMNFGYVVVAVSLLVQQPKKKTCIRF